MKVIIEDRQFIDDLERLQYEVFARKNIISYLLESNKVSECFEQYHKEYLEFFKLYEKKKQEVEKLYVKPVCPMAESWNLDFMSGELTID